MADGVRPGMATQGIDLVSWCLGGDGCSRTGWEEETTKAQRHQEGRFRLAPILAAHQYAVKVRNGALTLRDVRNEDRPGYVHENTGDDDKMSSEKHGFYTKMHLLHDNRQQSTGLLAQYSQFTR
jgi:hypothetical protein